METEGKERIEEEEPEKPELPLGVGRLTGRWALFMAVAAIGFAIGLYGWLVQFSEGHGVTGLGDVGTSTGTPWGLYIVFDIYFVGISFAGIMLVAFVRLLRMDHLRPIARIAVLLTAVSLLLAAIAVLADLGQPIRGIQNLLLYARPQSPFFGTFALVVVGYFFASVVFLYLDGRHDAFQLSKLRPKGGRFWRLWAAGYKDTEDQRRRHEVASYWLSIAIVPLLIAATSTLGLVYGLQVGRPGWHSALQAPAFVVLAGLSGLGAVIILAAVLRRVYGARERVNGRVFGTLGKMLLVLTAVYLYFVSVELLTMTYTGQQFEVGLVDALLWGEYAWMWWGSVVLLVAPFGAMALLALRGTWNVGILTLCGVMVNVAAVLKRYVLVVPSLTHGQLLPYAAGTYAPTWVEYAVVVGLFALGALLIGLFAKVFPIMHLPLARGGERVGA